MTVLSQEIWSDFISQIKEPHCLLPHTASTAFYHPFLKRLQHILTDTQASGLDLAYGIRDVLACVSVNGQLYGTLNFFDDRLSAEINSTAGIKQDRRGHFSLINDKIAYPEVYQKRVRRFIRTLPLDPMLRPVFKHFNVEHYNGAGQRQAVRSILSSEENSTIFVQLPTGCGKTLLVHALSIMKAAFDFGGCTNCGFRHRTSTTCTRNISTT